MYSGGSVGLLNRSSIRWATTNPPPILIAEIPVAVNAQTFAAPPVVAATAPLHAIRPPTTVRPEIAFVTAMRGECRAGRTPRTS